MKKKKFSGALSILLSGLLLSGCTGQTLGSVLGVGSGIVREEERETGCLFITEEQGAALQGSQPPEDIPENEDKTEPETIAVYVCGYVNEAGVCFLPEGARLYQAVEAAGGFSAEAACERVNLAARVADGCRVYIPGLQEEAVPGELEVMGSPAGGRVNINTAGKAELMNLPGVGESKAEAIISYRRDNGKFTAPEDIMKVPGIKDKAFEKLREYIGV